MMPWLFLDKVSRQAFILLYESFDKYQAEPDDALVVLGQSFSSSLYIVVRKL